MPPAFQGGVQRTHHTWHALIAREGGFYVHVPAPPTIRLHALWPCDFCSGRALPLLWFPCACLAEGPRHVHSANPRAGGEHKGRSL